MGTFLRMILERKENKGVELTVDGAEETRTQN